MAANEWDDFASGWDANDDVRLYAERTFASWAEKAAPLVPGLSAGRILDFGCGTGLLTEKLAPLCSHLVAVDTSEKMIDVLHKKVLASDVDNVTSLQIAVNAATLNECEDLASKFDLIVASSVGSFLPDYEATLADLTSVLTPGACFVQWDWLTDMPVARIENAFAQSGLTARYVAEAFTMGTGDEAMAVVMGVGQLPG